MLLINNKEKLLEFIIDGYQFPDDDWLNILIKVKTKNIQYEKLDPCVQIHNIKHMVEGLEKFKNGDIIEYETDFLEPYLKLKFYYRLKNNSEVIQIEFQHLFQTAVEEWELYRLNSSIPRNDFEEILRQLNVEFNKLNKI